MHSGTETVKTNQNFSDAAPPGEIRLFRASLPVTALFGLILGHLFTQQVPSPFPILEPESQADAPRSKIFPVLVEQLYRPKPVTDQFRALSDVTAEGKGRITMGQGFHTLTDDDTVEVTLPGGRSGNAGSQEASTRQGRGAVMRPGQAGQESASSGDDGRFRVPANYRFRQDFVLAYDGSPRFSVARQELAGFKYFQNMFRRIRETFAPPGLNYAYQDMAGTVVNQPIKPQIVEIAFVIDDDGNVRDVKKISSMGQDAVDRACMETLIGQNFGKPPPEIFANGRVFGIGFVFPAVLVR